MVVIVISVLGMVAMNDKIGELVVPPASSGATHEETPGMAGEQVYLGSLDPYLSVVIGEGNRLAELGQARSRNVIELGVRMDRFRAASAELQAYIETHDPPARLVPMVDELMVLLGAAESAIQASISAIRAFDWDSLGISVDEFDRAVEAIELLSSSHN